MQFLFVGLLEEELGQQLELALLEVGGDAHVLHARAELMSNLVVEGTGKFTANQHGVLLIADQV
jgi:hypothetical protein